MKPWGWLCGLLLVACRSADLHPVRDSFAGQGEVVVVPAACLAGPEPGRALGPPALWHGPRGRRFHAFERRALRYRGVFTGGTGPAGASTPGSLGPLERNLFCAPRGSASIVVFRRSDIAAGLGLAQNCEPPP